MRGLHSGDALRLVFDFGVKLSGVIVIEAKGSMNLRETKMLVLLVNRLGAPAVGQMVEHHFDDFDVRIINPRDTAIVAANVGHTFKGSHARRIAAGCPFGKGREGGEYRALP